MSCTVESRFNVLAGRCLGYSVFLTCAMPAFADPAPAPESQAAITVKEVPAAAVRKPQERMEDLPAAVKNLERHGVQIVGEFEAPGGLKAYAGIAQQQPLAVYLTPDSKHVIVGTMMDEEGTDVTQASLKQATIGAWTAQTWDALSESSWIADGSDSAKRIVYMFTDPNCPFCHKFWTQARPWIKAGKVQVRHIMVGLLTESSPGKAAAILASDDPARALEDHESAGPEHGIQPLGSVPDDVAIKLQQNRELMEQLQIQGTPGIFYFDAQGELQIQRGAPLDEHLEEILGPR